MNYSLLHRNIFGEIFNKVDIQTLGRLASTSKEIKEVVKHRLSIEKNQKISKEVSELLSHNYICIKLIESEISKPVSLKDPTLILIMNHYKENPNGYIDISISPGEDIILSVYKCCSFEENIYAGVHGMVYHHQFCDESEVRTLLSELFMTYTNLDIQYMC